jgi:hypothetical protein
LEDYDTGSLYGGRSRKSPTDGSVNTNDSITAIYYCSLQTCT